MPRKVKDESSPPTAGSDAAVKAEIAKGEAQFTEAEKAAPVALAVAKRLRAARKRLNRIVDLEGAAAQGKELNDDQVQPSLLSPLSGQHLDARPQTERSADPLARFAVCF